MKFLKNEEIYEEVIDGIVLQAEKFLWIATADIKDLYVKRGRSAIPFLEVLSDLIGEGVSVRLIHAKEPGPNFRKDFDRYPNLIDGLERMLCPRVHFKHVIVDGKVAYMGSANLTGAGMGAKSKNRRNLESGVLAREATMVRCIMAQFDEVWIGNHCTDCGRRAYCTDCPLED